MQPSSSSTGLASGIGTISGLDVEILLAVAALLTSEDSDARDDVLAALADSIRASTATMVAERMACGVILVASGNTGIDEAVLRRGAVAIEQLASHMVRSGVSTGMIFEPYNAVLGPLRDAHLSIVDLSTSIAVRGPHLGSCANTIVLPAVVHPRFASELARRSMSQLDSDVRERVLRPVLPAIDLGLGTCSQVSGVPVEACRLVRLNGIYQRGDRFRNAALLIRRVVEGC